MGVGTTRCVTVHTETLQRTATHCNTLQHMFRYNEVRYGDTVWRRSIGCLISWITFRERATNYRALLRGKTYKDKASLPPCIGLFSRLDFEMLKGRHNVKEQFVSKHKMCFFSSFTYLPNLKSLLWTYRAPVCCERKRHCSTLQHTATHCNTLQRKRQRERAFCGHTGFASWVCDHRETMLGV